MSLLKNSCKSLNDPLGEHFTGEKLLEVKHTLHDTVYIHIVVCDHALMHRGE